MTSAPVEPQYGVVLVTASSQAEATAIAEALVGEKLAACVSVTPIHSTYTWPYEVPELIALPIVAGSLAYLQWISEQVKP
jgi:periplasmic divalent cation tolerance protein